jgi:probable F420-dependent oxidoreductase
MARAAEESGFESIWVGDHLQYGGERPEAGPWEAWTTLAALAQATERVRLGPLVACAGFHPPGVIAKMAATIDEVSGGRFVLGIGSGWNDLEFKAFSIPLDKRVSRFEEAFAIIRGLLHGERVTFQGRYFSAEDAVLLPPAHRRTPIMVGSNGPRMLSIALPHADAWNTWWDDYDNDPEKFAELNDRISAAAREAGRDPADIVRSACVLVQAEPDARERPARRQAPPVPADRLREHLDALAAAGADEAILVLNPITEASVRRVGELLPASR